MNLRTRLRTTPAVWTAPIWLGIVAFYYFHALHLEDSYEEVIAGPLWAPEQVQLALSYFYVFAYAITIGLAVWEGGRLKRDGVWQLAPGRSRYRVAAHTLLPVIGAGWLVLALPVVMRLIETRLMPTPAALAPLFMAMGIVCAYAVLGCALGQLAPRVISAPLSAVAVFYVIAETVKMDDPVWPRHSSGQLDTDLAFGEEYGAATLLVPLLFIVALAAAVGTWWIRSTRGRQWAIRGAAGAAAVAVMASCVDVASGWAIADGPVSSGHAAARCTGSAPRVCMAETGGAVGKLGQVRAEIVESVTRLRAAGVAVRMPGTVSDSLLNGRDRKRSSDTTWWLPLSRQAGELGGGMTAIRYAVLRTGVTFPCAFPVSYESAPSADYVVNHDAAMLWAASVINVDRAYLAWRRGEYGGVFENPRQVLEKVKERAGNALKLPAEQQTAWFHEEQEKACRLVGQGAKR
ncbi:MULTISPECIES: hypothetical protein [Streptomyces]|uniref:hypothetical protein n=1 Tax=Streptomyces TaxID=1883 RepID=UPI001E2AE8D2|nr:MULTISPECIES: hypothetical protein [Streptomyces]UFQ15422.1 hypothetical protein J2N69_10685 [Streptomyces huasconensis]WCL85026.1 hypothetical protein PPN52_10695 [Streptomyces sp. JCM 35825]